ncbi:hypothetical protein Lser_V15G19712 [Lactuca serriola]
MAYSSTSSIRKSFKYDVFLSFRGEDTGSNFVDHLYYALQQKNIHTYKDDEGIKKGKRISDELIRSIEESRFYIIIFSKNYASSSWCLDELVKIMECHGTTEHTAYPVFYDVEPSEVRRQSGTVEEAFSKHKMEEASGKWREALKEAADLAGWELKNTTDGHEAKFIQKIVEELSLELRSISLTVDEKLVGMETRIKDVVSSLGSGIDDVRMIGIKGMGGGGKTTLARAVFDQISFQFEGKSFVENVREVSNASLSGLKSLQKQILRDVLNDKCISVSSVYDGKHVIKRMMHDRKVLVVLDDVDNIDQLEALAGETNWFKPGSRIIITTRDEQVLVSHRVQFIRDINLLSDKEAVCLFSRYAFGRDSPIQGYEKLSREVIRYAAGLPLTLRVLEEDYKEIFLDVACILKGWPKEVTIKALESCGFHARNGLRVLEQKSLITISDNNLCVGMHDHIEEMGRNIVRRAHPDKPYKHSRLWISDEIEDVLANDLGTKATRYIKFHNWKLNPHIIIKGLRKMKELRFLSMDLGYRLQCWEFDIVSPDFPNALRYLDLKHYPFSSLPETFQANNLVALEMVDSKIVQLWEVGERKVLNKLKYLDLSRSMLRTLDLGLTPNLETLNLGGCSNLEDLHIPIGCLKLMSINISMSRLRTLDLSFARNLKKLLLDKCFDLIDLHMPSCSNLEVLLLSRSKLRTLDIKLTPNLKYLDLNNCYYLEELHMVNVCENLTYLEISHSKLRTLDLGLTPNLERLDLNTCSNLVELHTPIRCLQKLIYLDVSGCLRFRDFLFNLKCDASCSVEESLEVVPLAELHVVAKSLEQCPLHPDNDLPNFRFSYFYKEDHHSLTRNLEMLISIGMCACTNLETFSGSICGLQRLRKLKLEGSIQEAPKDLGQLECLEELIFLSTKINHLPESMCKLKHLKSLKLISCWFLEKLPEDLGGLERLEELTLFCTLIKDLPDSICMLKHLKSLELFSCSLLEKLPEEFGRLKLLEKLELSHAKITHLPDSICMLKQMKHIDLHNCSLLEKLPEDLGRLECLEKLIIINCKLLQNIPISICRMKCLKDFHLRYCIGIEKLPEELGSLDCLKELDIEGTIISHLPQSILLLKGLRIIGSRELLQSSGFTSEIRIQEHETSCYVVVG